MAEEDPFELFRQTVKQFNPQGAPFDPSEFGTLGWPMTPVPMGAVADAGDVFSPEAGTKRAVRQLYSAIEELSDGPAGADTTTDIWEQYLEMFTFEGFAPETTPEQFGTMLLGTYQVWLYSLSQLLVESYTMQLVTKELVVEDHANSLRTQEWLWELSQPDREQLLMRCTDIDDDLIEEMEAVRTRRNELLYDLGSWDRVALEDPLGDARRYLSVLSALDALVNEENAFSYLPGQVEGDDTTQETADEDGAGPGTTDPDERANGQSDEAGENEERTGSDETPTDDSA